MAIAQDYASNSLILDVYLDGSVNIEYRITPDPTLARVNISLIGSTFSELLTVDQDGIILDWDQNQFGIEVDSVGAEEITISYISTTLTNKNGSIWTINLETPTSTLYRLSPDAVLVELYPDPTSITIIESRAAITLPQGDNKISYMLGSTGIKEHALVLLSQVKTKIGEANQLKLEISSQMELYEKAKQSYQAGSYNQAEQLSQQIIEELLDIIEAATSAEDQMTVALTLLEQERENISSETASVIQAKINEAQNAYDIGEYVTAESLALEAVSLIMEAEVDSTQSNLYLYLLGLTGLLISIGYIVISRQKKSIKPVLEVEKPEVDLDRVFRENPHLRTDEKAVLRFIEESNGAFVREIRDRFDMPKSTAWRMANRLEEEGLVDVSMVGRETYLELRYYDG
jgi:uncharacterized membrane protein